MQHRYEIIGMDDVHTIHLTAAEALALRHQLEYQARQPKGEEKHVMTFRWDKSSPSVQYIRFMMRG